MPVKRLLLLFICLLLLAACQQPAQDKPVASSAGAYLAVEIKDPGLTLPDSVEVKVLGEGFEWSEGPVWIDSLGMLLFSDIPVNTVYSWTEKQGIREYLTPSGYTGENPRSGEPGANGLALTDSGSLILCHHGDRRIALMEAPLSDPEPQFRTLADNYEGKKFNSPNDMVIAKDGTIYFTDPPYGLEQNMDDPEKELPFQGIFRLTPDGVVTLLTDSVSRPNGIALTPGEDALYIANSDRDKAYWLRYDITPEGIANGKVFYDATGLPGGPDGLVVSSSGRLYATGSGGIWIFSPDGTWLGKIKIDGSLANCTLSGDEKYLFVTADDQVLRISLN